MRLAKTTLITSSFSRACVHSACSVYMPAPSACRQTTLRPGQATAAPVAQGNPWPIAPPVICSQSCGAALKVGANSARPEVTASSATMQFSGSSAASVLAKASGSNFPRTSCGGSAVLRDRHALRRAQLVGQPFECGDRILLRPREHVRDGVRR